MARASRKATYDDVRAAPEHVVAEIVDGELYTSPRPAFPHALATTMLATVVTDRYGCPPGGEGRPGGWWILFEPELHLGADVLVPDLAGWRRERMARVPDVAAATDAPDWVCETLSVGTSRLDRTRKMPLYARAGVTHLWLLDPSARTLEVYRRETAAWVVASTHGGDEIVRAEPFDAVELDMQRWWGEQ
jgi:Uma2 family endonuclease